MAWILYSSQTMAEASQCLIPCGIRKQRLGHPEYKVRGHSGSTRPVHPVRGHDSTWYSGLCQTQRIFGPGTAHRAVAMVAQGTNPAWQGPWWRVRPLLSGTWALPIRGGWATHVTARMVRHTPPLRLCRGMGIMPTSCRPACLGRGVPSLCNASGTRTFPPLAWP